MEIRTIWFGCNVMSAHGDRTGLPPSSAKVACHSDQNSREHGKRDRDGQAFREASSIVFGKDDEAGGEQRQASHDRSNLRERHLLILRYAASQRLGPRLPRSNAILCDSGHILSAPPPKADILPRRPATPRPASATSFSPGSPFRPREPSYMRDLSRVRTENRRIRNGWWLRILNPKIAI